METINIFMKKHNLVRHPSIWCRWENVDSVHVTKVSQPHFEGSVRSPLTLPKMGLGSPPGLLKIESTIAGVKTLRIEMFFILLERS
jgi:hypothetical protein